MKVCSKKQLENDKAPKAYETGAVRFVFQNVWVSDR